MSTARWDFFLGTLSWFKQNNPFLSKEVGKSFYVYNDIFRYQDDIFVDEHQSSLEPASGDAPIEVDSFQEEQIIVDSTTIAAIPEPEIVQPTPDPIPEPVEPEPVVEETTPGNIELRLLSSGSEKNYFAKNRLCPTFFSVFDNWYFLKFFLNFM